MVGQQGVDAGEAEPVAGRLGEVVVAAGDVGAAVDHRDGDRAAAVAQPDHRPAGERAVGDAERARRQRAAAGDAVAVEARAVVGGAGVAVAGQVPDRAPGAARVAVVRPHGPDRVGAAGGRRPARPEAPAGAARDLQRAPAGAAEDDPDAVAAARPQPAADDDRAAGEDAVAGEVQGDVRGTRGEAPGGTWLGARCGRADPGREGDGESRRGQQVTHSSHSLSRCLRG